MLKFVTVTNFKGETLEMELAHPEKSGLCIYNIEGLGGGKATVNTKDSVTGDGSWYNSARAEQRNIVLYMKLMMDPSVEENRHKMYQYFPIKTEVRLLFTTDQRALYITGHVESNETPIFTSEEFSTISIICSDPFFYNSVNPYDLFTGLIPKFEFPFADDCFPDPDEPWEVIYYNPNYITNFDLIHPVNSSGYDYFGESGETINDWFFDNESPGNGAIFLRNTGLEVRQYSTNSYPIRFYTEFGRLLNGGTYTASYVDADTLRSKTFTINRPLNEAPFEEELETNNPDFTYKIISDSGSDIYRFEIRVTQSVNSFELIKGAKVEEGVDQTLATFKNGEWIITKDPGEGYDPYPGTIEFGQLENETKAIVRYEGTQDIGFTIRIHIIKPSIDMTVYNLTSGEYMTIIGERISMIIGDNIQEDDVIEISTRRGHKTIELINGTGSHNILGALSATSKWLKLYNGDNILEVEGSGNEDYQFSIQFSYNEAYEGL